jgi:hypothetical protein
MRLRDQLEPWDGEYVARLAQVHDLVAHASDCLAHLKAALAGPAHVQTGATRVLERFLEEGGRPMEEGPASVRVRVQNLLGEGS